MATHSSTLAWKIPWTEELGAGYCPWGRKEWDKTEQLHFHFQLYSLIIYTLSKNVEGDLHIHLNN